MTDREKAIVMAYTGVVMLSGDKLDIYYQYAREKLGRCVMTHELAFPEVQDALTDAAKNDFIELASGNNASSAGGWISVKDRRPEAAGYECIVCAVNTFGQKDVFIAFTGYGDMKWYTMDTTKIGKFVHGNNEVSEAWTITHWMPLPELPKGDEDV